MKGEATKSDHFLPLSTPSVLPQDTPEKLYKITGWVFLIWQSVLVQSGEVNYNLESAFPVMGTNSPSQSLKHLRKGTF